MILAFYASNRKDGFIINGSIQFKSEFWGTSIGSILNGFAVIFILPYEEDYVITFPSAFVKGFFFGKLTMELVGNVFVSCQKTGYKAQIEFKAKPFFGGEYNVICGCIKNGQDEKLYQINGKWDTKIEITNLKTKENKILWEVNENTTKLRMNKEKPIWEEMKPFESVILIKLFKKIIFFFKG